MTELVQRFLADFAANDRALRAMGYDAASQRLELLQQEAALSADRIWIKAEPANQDHKTLLARIGVVHSGYRDHGRINRPTAIRKVGGEYWVASYYQRIARFDANWTFLGWWPGAWGADHAAGQYSNVEDFAVDEANDRLFAALGGRHRVMAFQLSDGSHLWTWGDGTPGDYADNRPNTPRSVELLPNGNVAVAVWNGAGPAGVAAGYVAELDGTAGTAVAARLERKTDGFPWNGEVDRPIRIRLLNGRLYVSLYYLNGGMVGVFDPTTWQPIETYTQPQGWDVQSVSPWGLCLDDPDPAAATELVVCANSPKVIVALGLTDHDYKWHAGEQRWDDRAGADNIPGELHDIRDVLPLGGGLFAVADYGNNRIMVLPRFNTMSVPYTVAMPTGYRLVTDGLPEGFDPATYELAVKLNRLHQVGPLYLPLERMP